MLLPGSTLGVLGGGQLGRMFTLAARVMGYKVVVLDPDPEAPAGQFADIHLKADYTDATALLQLGNLCQAVTTEFENVPAKSLEMLAKHCFVSPSSNVVAIAQDRLLEKTHAQEFGCETAPFANIQDEVCLAQAWRTIGGPALLKTRQLGYDGKGQIPVNSFDKLVAAHKLLGRVPCLLERQLDLDMEVSVILARNAQGDVSVYPVAENQHRNGILDISIVPARIPGLIAKRVADMALRIAAGLNYVGVLAVEFFILKDGRIVFNEMAPRPHNSGHYTLDTCLTDQFQQQVRALAGLPLGESRLLSPVVMVNLLGDLWQPEPAWNKLLQHPNVALHLYGKTDARPGRKMGHYNCVASLLESALSLAQKTRLEIGLTNHDPPAHPRR